MVSLLCCCVSSQRRSYPIPSTSSSFLGGRVRLHKGQRIAKDGNDPPKVAFLDLIAIPHFPNYLRLKCNEYYDYFPLGYSSWTYESDDNEVGIWASCWRNLWIGVSKRFETLGRFSTYCNNVQLRSAKKNRWPTALIFFVFSFRLKYMGFPSWVVADILPNGT